MFLVKNIGTIGDLVKSFGKVITAAANGDDSSVVSAIKSGLKSSMVGIINGLLTVLDLDWLPKAIRDGVSKAGAWVYGKLKDLAKLLIAPFKKLFDVEDGPGEGATTPVLGEDKHTWYWVEADPADNNELHLYSKGSPTENLGKAAKNGPDLVHNAKTEIEASKKTPPDEKAFVEAQQGIKKEIATISAADSAAVEYNIAPYGKQPSPRGTLQAHHIVQNEWAEANILKYSKYAAQSILLDRGAASHSIITTRQNQRRDDRVNTGKGKWSSSLTEEFKNALEDLKAAGVPDNICANAIQAAKDYFGSFK